MGTRGSHLSHPIQTPCVKNDIRWLHLRAFVSVTSVLLMENRNQNVCFRNDIHKEHETNVTFYYDLYKTLGIHQQLTMTTTRNQIQLIVGNQLKFPWIKK